ncbi:hypothetical protein CARUB_v10015687mg [Capsella rubella]|uniref:FHA domain-containing protein n=2 Tax=Capsella rubella TaxID=81985 RepID=R0I399_9BRAS|nr:hypothetical protein CARUB_v10015687mg [Capsella rubella]
MVPPLLKLEFTQGPRAGDSLGFKPGSTIRIGRIVRGNEIAIKDAGISTKHLRLVSDSENWIIHDLGSSNGTILNSETIDPDNPINLSHGDEIKLGEYTSIVVNFVSDVQAPQEHKLPPRPRRNNKRLAVSDPDPDPIESVQEKPKRTRRSSKQEESELPKRTRASKKKTLEEIVDKEEEVEVKVEKKVNSRVGRPQKNANSAITKEDELPEDERGNSRVQRGKNSESVQNLGLDSIKLEVEDTPKRVEISEVKSRKRATRSKQIENACLGLGNVKTEDTVLEVKDAKRATRATRSTKNEIGGDSFLELEMVLSLARKSRAKRRKMEQEPSKSVVEMETRNDDTGEEVLKNCHVEEDKENEAQGVRNERSDDKCDREEEREGDGSKRVETDLRKKNTIGEDDLNCTVREHGETENLQDIEEDNGNKAQEGCSASSDEKCDKEDGREGDGSKSVEQVEIELRKKSTIAEDDLSCTVIEDGETESLQDIEEENGNEAQEGYSERSDDKCDKEDEREGDGSKRVEQVEIEIELTKQSTIGEDDLNCTVREDADTGSLQQIEKECHEEAGMATLVDDCEEEKVEQGSSNWNVERVEVDIRKMTLRNWFDSMEAQLRKQTIEETEKMIEPMRSKTLRVYKHIAEQKEKGV